MKRIFTISFALLAIAGISACSDDSSPTGGGGGGDPTPPATLTFQDFVGPLFAAKCTNGACHGSSPGQSGFSVLTYNSVLVGGTRSGGNGIVAGDTAASVVLQQLGPNPPFIRMPFQNDTLLQSTRDSIAMWILAGAPDKPTP